MCMVNLVWSLDLVHRHIASRAGQAMSGSPRTKESYFVSVQTTHLHIQAHSIPITTFLSCIYVVLQM